MKELSKSDIQQLFDFTQQHRVRHLDVQIELVDHLASAIEVKITQNPNLSFQEALDQTYAEFGIFGFGKLEQEKQDAVEKQILRNVRNYVQSFLTPPRIFLTLLAMLPVYQLLNQVPNPLLFTRMLFGGLFFAGIFVYYYWLIVKRKMMRTYLEVKTIISTVGHVLIFFHVALTFCLQEETMTRPLAVIIAVWTVLSIVATIGMFQYAYFSVKKIEERYVGMVNLSI
ncbi:MAG: hypothetical protein AAF960_14830 [Bacteroidota bacterium]